MTNRASMFLIVLLVALLGGLAAVAPAQTPAAQSDWPMAGHDPARTSRAPLAGEARANLKPLWYKIIDGFIPSEVQVVTAKGRGGVPDLLFIANSEGVLALKPEDGAEFWFYRTEMPVGHSPTIVDGVAYVSCLDKTLHAVSVADGKPIWRTAKAGAGFDVSPLVVNGKVLAGCRDGFFYAFDARDGKLLWHFETDGSISNSAAYADGVVYFASNDSHAYALKEQTGELVWKSAKLPGDGFYSFWPVVAGDRILLAGSTNYYSLINLTYNRNKPIPADKDKARAFGGPARPDGWYEAKILSDYHAKHPTRRTTFVLDRSTGKEVGSELPGPYAPILYKGNPGGVRMPPAVDEQGVAYFNAPYRDVDVNWMKGDFVAWKIGTTLAKPVGSGADSNDELDAGVLVGPWLFHNHKEDQVGGIIDIASGRDVAKWGLTSLKRDFPNYDKDWELRKYGNIISKDGGKEILSRGTHGYPCPPVPLDRRLFFHASNSVICYGF